ncbi:MAG TPA: hypothetical protein VI461_07625 [Chitinophagaceae bacterium]|nr:hypothetical protein [Chitinophagaceae bacterium]
MKKTIIMLTILVAGSIQLTAQTSATEISPGKKFISAMETNLRILDTASNASSFIALANNFDRIAAAEKTKWEPFYYAAYCYAVMAAFTPDKTKIDMLTDKADLWLQEANNLQKGNSEIAALFAMIKSLKILVDPVNRWQKLGQEVAGYLTSAKQQDANNPRPYLIEARIKFNTPEGLGGGKEAAKALITDAITKFGNFKPQSSIAPNWGLQQAESFLAKLNESK